MVRSDWYVKSVLEVRIGWESRARTHIWPFLDVLLLGNLMNAGDEINVVYKYYSRLQLCGRHNLMNVGDEIELIAQRVFGSLTTHVNKMNWAIYNSYLLK